MDALFKLSYIFNWGEGLVRWLGRWYVCAAPRVQLFAIMGNGIAALRHGIISSCQSAATSEIVKALLDVS